MSNIVSYEPTQDPMQVTAGKLGKVILLAPYMLALTDTPASANSLNVFNLGGFPEPDAAPSGATITGSLTGAYAYYITFYDSNTDTESNPSAQSATVNPSGQGVRVTNNATNNATNSRVTHWRIYRNVASGSTYYLVATVAIASSTYDDDNSDSTIQANDTLELDNNAPAADTYQSVLTYRNFAFLYGAYNGRGGTDYDDRVIWSKVGNIDAFPSVNETDFAEGQHGIIRALAPAGPALLMYKDSAIIRWIFRTDPSGIYGDGDNDVVNDQRGAINPFTIVNHQGTHIVMDRKGIYATRDGSTIDEITFELDTMWQRINWAQRHKFCATWDDRKAWFFVALDEDEECHYAFVLDLLAVKAREGQQWYPEYYAFGIRHAGRQDMGMTSAATVFGMERKVVPVAIDDQMRVHILSMGWRDGLSPELTAESTVASSGSTTTVVKAASGTFTATNGAGDTVNVVDLYLTWDDPEGIAASVNKPGDQDWEREYRITALGGSNDELTVTPAMPVAPPAGATFYIGARPKAKLLTPMLSMGNPGALKKIAGVNLESQPGGMPYSFRMRMSGDRQGWFEMQETSDSDQSKYTTTQGRTEINVKQGGNFSEYGRKGYCELPGASYKGHYFQLEFDCSKPDCPVVIDNWEIDTEAA